MRLHNYQKKFDYSVLKINDDGIISANHHQINATLCSIKDDQKQFSINKKKFQILKNKVDEYIKKYHDDSLQKHLTVSKILQLL